ncbi:MAG TPA: hypothetical protein PKB10_02635, partial [Tepidisphaeraceae bacterium]|nr:hypothetical protein [Tepidisphaeraceae bacterium]
KTARESALAGFANNADYQANEKLAQRLTLQLEEAHAVPREFRDQSHIDALARVKVQTLSSNRDPQRDALDTASNPPPSSDDPEASAEGSEQPSSGEAPADDAAPGEATEPTG